MVDVFIIDSMLYVTLEIPPISSDVYRHIQSKENLAKILHKVAKQARKKAEERAELGRNTVETIQIDHEMELAVFM